ncbi:MAG: phosphate ABC transporter substrate-binding protein [Methanobacteriaceae archaeon]
MNAKYKVLILLIIIIIGVIALVVPGTGYERVDIVGSTSVQPVAEKLAIKFQESHNGTRINVQGGGSGMGIRSTEQGIAEIGMSSKSLSDDEKENITEVLIGKEGIVIGVSKVNSIEDLTKNQVKDIFSGKITNWEEVGGSDMPINVVTREEGSGTRQAFESIVMGDESIKDDAIVQSSTESVAQSVKSDPGAIGFLSFSHLSGDVKPLKIEGVTVSEATIADGSYSIQRPFLFLVKGTPTGTVKEFLDWIHSPEGIKIIKKEKIVV